MTPKRTKWRTIEEMLADPDVRARRESALQEVREAEARAREETAHLRSELAAVGVEIDLIWDLVNTRERYDQAVPVLIKHLKRPYSERTREGIARALTIKAAKPFAKDLIGLFKSEDDATNPDLKWAIGNALTVAAGQDHHAEIIEMALNQKHGKARSALLPILKRSKRPEAQAALMRLLADPDLDVRLWAEKFAGASKPQTRKRN
jgi:HEAT repeat protein